MVMLDVGDIARPGLVARAEWDGGSTHTCLPLPGRGLVVATDRPTLPSPQLEVLYREAESWLGAHSH